MEVLNWNKINLLATGYGLDGRDSEVRCSAGAGNFSLLHRIQTGSGAYWASDSMGNWSSFPKGKAAGGYCWPLTSF